MNKIKIKINEKLLFGILGVILIIMIIILSISLYLFTIQP